MSTKTEYLQIRVRPDQKAALKRRAEQTGADLSTYVLSRLLPTERSRFEEILVTLRDEAVRTHALAELNDLLTPLSTRQLRDVVAEAELGALPEVTKNYVAAMVEHACHQSACAAPDWTRRVMPLEEPFFATTLKSVRPHLLKSSPVAFKRRNIFIDSTLGNRV